MGIFRKVISSIAGNQEDSTRKSTRPSKTRSTPLTPPTKPTRSIAPGADVYLSPPQQTAQSELPQASVLIPHLNDLSPLESHSVLDEVVEGLDEAFDSICSSSPAAPSSDTGLPTQEEAQVQDLFCQIAATYARPLKNFVFELQRHTATKDAIGFCRPIWQRIISAAETMNLPDTVNRMKEFDAALAYGQTSSEYLLKDEVRQRILACYEALEEVLPEAFQIRDEGQRREDIIIHSLLQQISGVGCVTFEKLYQAGLGSLRTLFLANPEDMAVTTAIQPRLSERICKKIQQYRNEAAEEPHHPGQSDYRLRLNELVSELRGQLDMEKTGIESGGDSPAGAERRMRRWQRRRCFLEVNVMLAELGELDLFYRLQKLSFKKRIQILDEFLAAGKTNDG